MKHVIFLGDGMADLPVLQLQNRTPLACAIKPAMDRMALEGLAGMVRTVPPGLQPVSETANLSGMGYDPLVYYTGRSPLEAISMAIDLDPDDVTFRCNLVTLTEPGQSPSSLSSDLSTQIMTDYSAGEIGSDEAARLIETINDHLSDDVWHFYPGKSYRHCLVWKKGSTDMSLIPPHDILTRQIEPHLPSGRDARPILDMMIQARDFLPQHPVNQARIRRNLNPANAIWIWGQGVRPDLPNLTDRYQLDGAVITAVDLVRGIGICAGLKVVDVPGATGTIDTNFRGKAEAAIRELRSGRNYVYLHVEAPDECGHHAQIEEKIRSIELIDEQIITPVWHFLEEQRRSTGEDYRLMVLPDHPTPVALRTHTADPVPFACYSSDGRDKRPAAAYDEFNCEQTGLFIADGFQLLERLTRRGFQDVMSL